MTRSKGGRQQNQQTETSGSTSRIAIWSFVFSGISLLSAIVATSVAVSTCGRQDRIDKRESRKVQQSAFLLGKRLMVWEESQAAYGKLQLLAPNAFRPPDSLKFIGMEEVKSSAEPLGIRIQYVEDGREPASALPRSIESQISEGHPRAVSAAFRLGRAIGAYDEGVWLVGEERKGSTIAAIHPEIYGLSDYASWIGRINSDLANAEVPIRASRIQNPTPYLVACQGRTILIALREWFANVDQMALPLESSEPNWNRWVFLLELPEVSANRNGVPIVRGELLRADSLLIRGQIHIPKFIRKA